MDLLFPPHARVSSQQITAVSNAAVSRSIFTGAARSVSRAGSRWRFGISSLNTGEREPYSTRAALQAFGFAIDGQANRCYYIDAAYRQRGSFAVPELLSNNLFTSGTAGWTGHNSSSDLTSSDRILRATFNNATLGCAFRNSSALATLSQYAPYVLRAVLIPGRGDSSTATLRIGTSTGASDIAMATGTFGLVTASGVTDAVSSIYVLVNGGADAGRLAGDYWECPFVSLTRCALVDNGVNYLLQSNDFSNAAWTKTNVTISANATAGPDGTTIADQFTEDSASSSKRVAQAATITADAQDISLYCYLKKGTRNFGWFQLTEATGGTGILAFFNLNTGVIGTVGSPGANWSNARTFITPFGNGWYRCHLMARKTNAATSIAGAVGVANVDGSVVYSGSGGAAMFAVGGGIAPSGVPGRVRGTTATTVTTGIAQSGASLRLKGLPASTNGLLLPGDRVQSGYQLNTVTQPLNSDSSGIGFLQCATAWRTAPADSAPIIVNNPMGRFMLTGNESGWSDSPGVTSDFEFVMEESLDVA